MNTSLVTIKKFQVEEQPEDAGPQRGPRQVMAIRRMTRETRNEVALEAILKENGPYLVTVHNGQIVSYTKVPRPLNVDDLLVELEEGLVEVQTEDAGDQYPQVATVRKDPAKPLEGLDLPARALNALQAAGYTSLEQLLQATDEDLLAVSGVGESTVTKIRELQPVEESADLVEEPVGDV